jgi:hypothetical protein
VDGVPWAVKFQQGGSGVLLEHLGPGSPDPADPDTSKNTSPAGAPALSDPLSDIMSVTQFFGNPDNKFAFYAGRVPGAVDHLVLALGDGETATVPAVVPSFPTTSNPALYVAFVLPAGLAVKTITVYGSSGAELGYSIPFNDNGFPVILSWYTPGQKPPPASDSGSGMTSGSLDGTAWEFSAWNGGFGACASFSMPRGRSTGTFCFATQSAPSARSVFTPTQEPGPGGDVLVYGSLNPAVKKVVLTLSDGAKVTPKLLDIGVIAYYADAFPPGTKLTEITTYDARGALLAQAYA